MSVERGNKCRLCFIPGLFHINLFTTSHTIVEAICRIFNCEIDEFDLLPNFICVDCWMTVQKFYEFYQNVIAVQNKFLLAEKRGIKIESTHKELEENIDYVNDLIFEPEPSNFQHQTEHHESIEIQEPEDALCTSDNETSELDAYTIDVMKNECDLNFQDSDQSESGDGDDGDDCDNGDDGEEYIEEYMPTKLNSNRQNRKTVSLPNRKRGRPKKVKDPKDGWTDSPGKRNNWRDGKAFKCPHCVKQFTRRYRVAIHIKLRHGFECSICNHKLPSEVKLKQHLNVHEDGFDIKLRQKLEEIAAIDTNDVSPDEKETIWKLFDLKCDKCPAQFRALNEAQIHYLNEHNISRGYIKCCDMKFREDNMIKEHIAYHKSPDIYTCFICNIPIKLKSYLRCHLKGHVNSFLECPKHICELCEKPFASKANLMYHKAEAHAGEKIKCEICSKTLYNHAQKEKHLRNAHETMSQQMLDYVSAHFDMSCDKCDVMFESFVHAKRHYLSEHGSPKGYLKCCNKKMRSLAAIDEHIQWHKNPEILRCPICHKLFKLKDHFKTHVRRHGKTFTCEVCGKSFKRHTTLVGHRKAVHESGPRNFQCRFCSLRFLSDEKRDGHEQLIHFGNTTGARIVCDICGKGFLQTSHLQNHIQIHHSNDPVKRAKKEDNKSELCTICGLWLSSRYRLKLHRKCHSMEPNRCQECGLEAPNHDALLGHIRAFHEIRHKNKCRLCNESFKNASELHEHASTHATDKLYRCAYCPESFVWRASLDAHMKKSHLSKMESEKSDEKSAEFSKLNSFDQEQPVQK